MRILGAGDIDGLITRKEAVDAMVHAFRIQEEGHFFMPDRMHVDFGENTLLLMPAFSGEVFSTKLVSLFPANKSIGLPPLFGTVILNDGQTGAPLALFNGAALTAMRTGAVGGVAMRYMVETKTAEVGIIGAGTQGIQQALYACSELQVTSMSVFDPDQKRMDVFKSEVQKVSPELAVHLKAGADEVVEASNVVITATSAMDPVFTGRKEWLRDMTFIAIGSYKPNMQELPDELYQAAAQVFVDTPHALRESGDLVQPIEDGVLDDSRIFLLGELLMGRIRLQDQTVTVFKSVGMALFDLVMADLLYTKSLEKGVGTEVDL